MAPNINDKVAQASQESFNELSDLLTSGSDDRSRLRGPKNVNKYMTKPTPNRDCIFRASCTCNFSTEDAYDEVSKVWNRMKADAHFDYLGFEDELRLRLKSALGLADDGCEVIFTPSGSDAEYIPVMIAKMLHPGRKVINIVTCGGEIGSFTLDCANGKHFSETLPVPSPDFEQPKIGQPLKGLGENVEAIAIKARLKTGNIANATREIEQILERSKKENAVSILHTVIGSKTGICESLRSKDNCIGVVDACQARVNFDEIKNVVQNGHFVLFTASKFFRAPPFCGAVLVPAHYVDQIVTIQSSLPKGLNHFLTSGNIPQKFHFWKTDLSTALNLGLILRWVAGIYAIEKSLSISFDERFQLESAWRKEICGEVEKSPYMEILDSTNIPSIVSIKVKIGLENLWLRKDELTKVCELMTEDLAHKIDNADQSFQYILKKECYMGQPVEIGSDFAVLRIALDYENIFQLKTNFEATLAEDKKLLSKLQSIIKNYQSLCL